MQNVKKIKIFGDSIMKGVLLDPTDFHYYTIANHGITWIEKEFNLEINNKAMFGCTVTKGMKLLERSKQKGFDCDIVLLEFGGNDCDFAWDKVAMSPEDEHFPNTPLDVFEDSYYKIISDLRQLKIHPLMMTIPPIDAERYLNWISQHGVDRERLLKWLGGDPQAIARYQELYSHTLSRIAANTHTQIVDIRSAFLSRRDFSSLLCLDGIHPNEKGHELITSVFADYAQKLLREVS